MTRLIIIDAPIIMPRENCPNHIITIIATTADQKMPFNIPTDNSLISSGFIFVFAIEFLKIGNQSYKPNRII